MIKVQYKLEIINDLTFDKFKQDLVDKNMEFKQQDNDEFIVTIDSIEKYKIISNILTRHIIDIKWDECFEKVVWDNLGKEFDNLSDTEKTEILKVKDFKRLFVITKKAIDAYLSVSDNESINLSSFAMFNMEGFEDYVAEEIGELPFELFNEIDEQKAEFIEIWEERGIKTKNYDTLFVFKDGNTYALYNRVGHKITYQEFTETMGFSVEGNNNLRNENSKYLTMILNLSAYLDTKVIYIDGNICKDLANLLVSNSSFKGNRAKVSLNNEKTMRQLMDIHKFSKE